MPSGLMEQIYRGILDPGIHSLFSQKHDFTRALVLVQKYRELLQRFPVAAIEQTGRIPAEMLAEMKKAGFFGVSVPQEHGGLGFSLFEYLKVIEEVSRIDMSPALVFVAHLSIGIRGIELFGTPEQKDKYLPLAASGEMIFSYALTEPLTGSDAKSITTQARLSADGSHYVLNGTKTYITNANYAGGLTVFARLDEPGKLIAFIVETAWEGVKIGADMPKMGLKASSTASIQFKDVKVPAANVLGTPGDGFRLAMMVLNYGRLGLGAASIGAMEQSIADMWKRSGSRVQFGQPIRNYQLVQEKIARTRVNAEAMKSMNALAASILSADPLRETAIETSHCKLFGTTRAWEAVYDALQVAGGSGYLSTQPYEKRMRDFRVTTIFEGTTEIHSMYPALLGLRRLAKDIKGLKGAGRTVFILKELLSSYMPQGWKAEHHEPVIRQAFLLAGANAQTIRRMLLLALLIHREKAAEREYLLRRITFISLYTFAVLALASRLAGQEIISGVEKESLACLIEEAREVRRRCGTTADTIPEIMQSRLFRQMEGQSP
jgi:acyl-CoA dehydrogenase family protein 9